MDPPWARHLPPGVRPESVDLLGARSLPAAWARNWAAARDAPAIHDRAAWHTAGELDRDSRRVAGRYARAGLGPGDRVVMSAATSYELVVAHVAAQRAGLVVVPVNGAYRAREIAAIVGDCAPAAAVVDSTARADSVVAAAPGPVVATTPEVELPDGSEPELDRAGPD